MSPQKKEFSSSACNPATQFAGRTSGSAHLVSSHSSHAKTGKSCMRLIVAITSRPAGIATPAAFLLFCSIAFGQLLPLGGGEPRSDQFFQTASNFDTSLLRLMIGTQPSWESVAAVGWRRASVGSVLSNSEQFRHKLISADDRNPAVLGNGAVHIDN